MNRDEYTFLSVQETNSHDVQPQAAGGGEVNMNAGGASFRLGMFMRAIVVTDDMRFHVGKGLVNGLKEIEPFLSSMATLEICQHNAEGNVDRSKERRDSVPFVVVR